MSPLWSKKTSVAATDERNIIILHRKIVNKANWEVFQSLCTDTITLESFKDSSDPLSDFTSSLIDISSKCIPKTSTNPTKSNPWYNDECKEAIKTRIKALNKFKKYPTKDNLNEVKVFRAKARRTIKISKRKSWRSYVSKINHKTPIKKSLGYDKKNIW